MVTSKIPRLISKSFGSFMSMSSIHGCSYLDRKSTVIRIFWALSMCISFSLCFYLIGKNVEEGRRQPTITTTETGHFEDLPLPAISVLVPRSLDPTLYKMRVLNGLNACEARLDFANSTKFSAFLILSRFHNNYTWNHLSAKTLKFNFVKRKVRELGFSKQLGLFCEADLRLNETERKLHLGSLYTRIDDLLMADDIDVIFENQTDKSVTNVSKECDVDRMDVPSATVLGWLHAVAPIAHKKAYRLACGKSPKMGFGSLVHEFLFPSSWPGPENMYRYRLSYSEISAITTATMSIVPEEKQLLEASGQRLRHSYTSILGSYFATAFQSSWIPREFLLTICNTNREIPFNKYMAANLYSVPACQDASDPELQRCCQFYHGMATNHSQALQDVLLHSIQPSHELEDTDFVNEVIERAFGEYGIKERKGQRAAFPMIFSCQIKLDSIIVDCSKSFKLMPSVDGLVYSLNQDSLDSLVALENANGFYHRKLFTDSSGSESVLSKSSGHFTLSMVLMPELNDWRTDDFRLVVHERGTVPDFSRNVIILNKETDYTIKMKVAQRSTARDLKSMPRAARNCLFADENEGLELFRNYTRANCVWECLVRQLVATCHCLPWDMMYHRSISALPCIGMRKKCAESVIANISPDKCNCPLDCNGLEFSPSILAKKWEPNPWRTKKLAFCFQQLTQPDSLFDYTGDWYFLISGMVDPYRLVHDNNFGNWSTCQDYGSKGAKLELTYSSSALEKYITYQRVTFINMLSDLGGTISLFTGMSILSLVELYFWMGVIVKRFLRGARWSSKENKSDPQSNPKNRAKTLD